MAALGLFGERESDPHKLSSPRVFLMTQVIFLILAGFVALILSRQAYAAFITNPGLNGLIFGVLLIGVGLALMQVLRLFREVRWVNSFRTGVADGTEPVLLAPMKTLLTRTQATSLSAASMRSLLDSIATRLDESRDIARYLTGLLVFLGLLGTFWGLLQTIGSIGDTIQTLEPSGDAKDMLDSLKTGLQAPLSGMGTAFSSSLFGLSGSLILGFLDLQSGRAQNRFYVELENWLSTVTDLGSDMVAAAPVGAGASGDDMKAIAKQIAAMQDAASAGPRSAQAMASLAEGISALVKNMRNEQQLIRDWVEAQAADNKSAREALERIAVLIERQQKGG
jgi:biopolymer transport protein ExbB/TolQ